MHAFHFVFQPRFPSQTRAVISTVADFIPNPNLFYTKYLIRYDDESDTGTEQIVFFSKIFIRLFVNIDYYYCFIFPILILYSQLGNFTCSWVQMFDFMENMYNIPNNHKMQQITFSKNFIIYFVFKTINRIYIHIFQLVVKIHAMEG